MGERLDGIQKVEGSTPFGSTRVIDSPAQAVSAGRSLDILLIALGSAGDVHPFVGLALELRRRGHNVTLSAIGYFAALARRLGLDFVETGSDEQYRAAIRDPDLWKPMTGFQAVARIGVFPTLRPVFDLVCERYRPGRTVVVSSTLGLGARAAREKLGVPLVTVHLQPSILRDFSRPPRLGPLPVRPWMPRWWNRFCFWLADRMVIDPTLLPTLNAFRAEVGLTTPVRRVFRDWVHSPDCVLGLWPEWWVPRRGDWPAQFVQTGFPLYDESGAADVEPAVEEFLASGDPPIAFTPGSAMVHGQAFFSAAAEACRRLGRRGLLLTRFPEQVPADLPPGVMRADYVPFSRLLPRAGALVHHGGIGTTSQGLAAGVPQLIMPMAHDQPDNAHRLRELGVGDWLAPARFTGPAVAATLKSLLESPAVAAACGAVRDRFRGADALAASCDVIERVGGLRS